MMNNTKTCVTIEACNTNICEAHNFRTVKLAGVRHDLSDQNVYEYKVSASERLAIIKREYKQTVGQRLQSHAHPVIEMVVVGIITRGQAELFVKKIEEKWGVEVLSWAVHVAEGREFTAQQLASESGYRSYSTFSAAFKQRTGKTVTAWMKDAGE